MIGPIVIHTDADFTPPGNRTQRIIQGSRAKILRWYVNGRIYRSLSVTAENLELGRRWMRAQPAP